MKYLIALLTAATGILHLVVGFGIGGDGATNWLLVLNGVGYLVLLVLFWMASGNGGIIRWILLAYTLITLIGYFVIQAGNNFGFDNTMGLIIKAIELLLVILLLLYRAPQKVVAARPAAASPSRMGSGIDTTPSAGQALGTTAATAAAGTSAAPAATAAAAVAMADRSNEVIVDTSDHAVEEVEDGYDATVDTAGDAVDYVGDKAEDAYDAAADMAGDAVDAVDDAVDATADAAGDAVDFVGDKAEDAYDAAADMAGDAVDAVDDTVDATADAAGDAVDYVGDKAEDAYDATADAVGGAVDYVGDKAEDAYDATADVAGETYDASLDLSRGAAVAGAGLVGAAAYDASEERAETGADLDAAQLAAEPSAEEIRAELEEYLRSFGPSSEFRKPIEYVEGIGAAYGQRLRTMDINTVMDLVVNGATRRGRKYIADHTGIAQSLILTWVNHVDLFRIKGVAEEYADLLEQSGVDTVVELAQRNPANLYKRMKDINEQKELVRRIPHASEVESWVQQAKSLRRLIYY